MANCNSCSNDTCIYHGNEEEVNCALYDHFEIIEEVAFNDELSDLF